MTRLKRQFLLFSLLLGAVAAFSVLRFFAHVDAEEKRLAQNAAERAYNQMQARISDWLTAEDARAFADYDPASDALADAPKDDPRGLAGYFQIEPDGSFSIPHRDAPGLSEKLDRLTLSFRDGTNGKVSLTKGDKTEARVDLDVLSDLAPADDEIKAEEHLTETAASEDANSELQYARLDKSPPKQQFYPNPLMQQKALPRKNGTFPPPAPAAELQEKKKDSILSIGALTGGFAAGPDVSGSRLSPLGASGAGIAGEKSAPDAVLVDPFRARLVQGDHVIFYRKAWKDDGIRVQGFAVELAPFYEWLMLQSLANSELAGIANARLEIADRTLASYGAVSDDATTLFQRPLGYPLSQFVWHVAAPRLPELPTRKASVFFATLALVALAGGLFALYRTAAAQVFLAQKRQDFVSAVTHELRTPLTSIRMSAEMLREGWIESADKKSEYYDVIARESERLGRLVENVLQLARLEKGGMKCAPVATDPKVFLEETGRELAAFAAKNGFAWEQRAADDPPPVRLDPDFLKQILWTLVDNAVKFSRFATEKKISLSLRRESGRVIFSVADRGPGVPKNELGKIFENFYRSENELTRQTKGTGIGLAMARMMAERMGARIEAENRKDGTGLAVSIRFPV